jgi:hypothetical protein
MVTEPLPSYQQFLIVGFRWYESCTRCLATAKLEHTYFLRYFGLLGRMPHFSQLILFLILIQSGKRGKWNYTIHGKIVMPKHTYIHTYIHTFTFIQIDYVLTAQSYIEANCIIRYTSRLPCLLNGTNSCSYIMNWKLVTRDLTLLTHKKVSVMACSAEYNPCTEYPLLMPSENWKKCCTWQYSCARRFKEEEEEGSMSSAWGRLRLNIHTMFWSAIKWIGVAAKLLNPIRWVLCW